MHDTIDNELERQDTVDRYVCGRMSPQEAAGFERLMNEDDDLADDVALLRLTRKTMASLTEKRRLIEVWDNEENGTETVGRDVAASSSRRIRIISVITGFAACLVLGFFLVRNITSDSADRSESVSLPAVTTTAVRSSLPSGDVAGMIEDGRYDAALERIGSEIAALDEERAAVVADKAMDDEERQYTVGLIDSQLYDMQWMRIVSLEALGRRDEADDLLKDFVTVDGQYREEALRMMTTR